MSPAVSEWSVDEVLAMLDGLGLGHLQQPFKENGVNGRLLVTMHETEFMEVGSAHRLFIARTGKQQLKNSLPQFRFVHSKLSPVF